MRLRRHSPLVDQVVEILRERIVSGAYAADGRLPSEARLVAEFDVSRATIRSALGVLTAEGLVRRRHGAGTFVSQLTRVSNPLNEVIDYRELIEGHGFEFGFQHIGATIKPATAEVREALRLPPDAPVLEVTKAFTADGELLIYTVNIIPEWVFGGRLSPEELTRTGATEPLFEFLEACCKQRIENYIAVVRPEIAQNIKVADQAPQVDPLLPVLIIEEVGFNAADQAVLYEIEYLFGDRMRFELIRRHRYPTR
jgi:GntR family transcriptional regulator